MLINGRLPNNRHSIYSERRNWHVRAIHLLPVLCQPLRRSALFPDRCPLLPIHILHHALPRPRAGIHKHDIRISTVDDEDDSRHVCLSLHNHPADKYGIKSENSGDVERCGCEC